MSKVGSLRSRTRRAHRGYTLVELMMALALFTVAMLGIISMQKMTAVSNGHSKNIVIAQHIAQAWATQLEMDATTWRSGTEGGFLNHNAVWQRPAYVGARKFGAAFDLWGAPLSDSLTDLAQANFCTHVRMSWLYPPTMNVAGNAVLRAEIRVFWLREGETPLDSIQSMCAAGQTDLQALNIGLTNTTYPGSNGADRYYFVYQTVAVRQH